MNGLGVRQRRTLVRMAHFGQGRWPSQWPLRGDDRNVLASLHTKGMVTDPDPSRAQLTDSGALAASWLRGERR